MPVLIERRIVSLRVQDVHKETLPYIQRTIYGEERRLWALLDQSH